MVNHFKLTLGDRITKKEKNNILDLINKLNSAKSSEEIEKQEEEIKNFILKPEVSTQPIQQINESVITKIGQIATPGYEFIREIEISNNTDQKIKLDRSQSDSITKQQAIQNVLLNNFQLEENQITILTERIKQEHLNHKYFAYYFQINSVGILIVLNDQYGQAARIKKIESHEDTDTQLAILIATLDGVDKKTLDEVHGFQAFSNTYASQEELKDLYKQKILQTLTNADDPINLSLSPELIWDQINGKEVDFHKKKIKNKNINGIVSFLTLPAKITIERATINGTRVRDIINTLLNLNEDQKLTSTSSKKEIMIRMNELQQQTLQGLLGKKAKINCQTYLDTQTKKEEIDLSQGTEGILNQINKYLTENESNSKQIDILYFLDLSYSSIKTDKIANTLIRKIINKICNLKEGEQINYNSDHKKVDKAKQILADNLSNNIYGDEAKEKHLNYLNNQINLDLTAEDIWKQIQNQTVSGNGIFQDKEIKRVSDFLDLNLGLLRTGTIKNTPVRDIINKVLNLPENKKIHYHNNLKNINNLENIELAITTLKKEVSEGLFGKQAQIDYNTYLSNQIDLSQTKEIICRQIQHQTVVTTNHKDMIIKGIPSLFDLTYLAIRKGSIGDTKVRDIINTLVSRNDGEQIKTNSTSKFIDETMDKLKEQVLKNSLGQQAKTEYENYLNSNPITKTIDLTVDNEKIWNQIEGKKIIIEGHKQDKTVDIATLIDLSISGVRSGKIQKTPVRTIFNKICNLQKPNRITTAKTKENTKNINAAKQILKQKFAEGELGLKAQSKYKVLMGIENIQSNIRQDIDQI